VQFHGPNIWIRGLDSQLNDNLMASSLPDDLAEIRAYDGTGHQLERRENNDPALQCDAPWKKYAFWGVPTEIRIFTADSWSTLDIPFDVYVPKKPAKG